MELFGMIADVMPEQTIIDMLEASIKKYKSNREDSSLMEVKGLAALLTVKDVQDNNGGYRKTAKEAREIQEIQERMNKN